MKVFIALVLAAGFGTVVAAIWIGSGVREEQVVDQPYETGLRYDADRAARNALGWTASVEEAAVTVGPAMVHFTVWDGAGAPLDGAQVTVAATRPETSRDRVSAEARALGGGRYEAELAFAAAGRWELALDVRRGADRLVLERDVTVSASPPAAGRSAPGLAFGERPPASPSSKSGAPPPTPPTTRGEGRNRPDDPVPLSPRAPGGSGGVGAGGEGRGEGGNAAACDLATAPCSRELGDGRTLTLDLTPRPLKAFADLAVSAELRDASGRAVDAADLAVSFTMPGMYMGANRAALAPTGSGRYAGQAVLVRCPSGRRDWRAEVAVSAAGMAPARATFEFRVSE